MNCGVDVLNDVNSCCGLISGCLRASAITACVASLSATLPRPVEILDLKFEAAGGAEARDRRRIEAQREGVRNAEQLRPHRRRRASRRSARAARSSHGFRIANSTAEFDCAALVRKFRPLIEPTMSTPGVALQDVADLLGDRVGAFQRGAVGQLDDDEEIALVLDRQEGRGNAQRDEIGRAQRRDEQAEHRSSASGSARARRRA